jgi:hypothetical protein
MGMALLVAVPLLSLILIRLLWSGSSLWFLTVGILLLGSAAVVYLLRRPPEMEPVRPGATAAGGIMDDNSRRRSSSPAWACSSWRCCSCPTSPATPTTTHRC